ncbi:putative development/cell death domain, kelch-type beta propeller [Helianthus annuus]|uniref:Development/cell death domain, kelch-type beta propeller n=3 Tax=Helianthus annuus TaxID=4232 RepID=A0A9K3GY73_HELAN|nr:putative development/cell death domain, kelch-type beta propeller [Helianthus annuus]KAJ0437748.1 putative DCD domain-containing protein NRP [Helianthus annuus]KAJ0460071.1 putative DCD domain-containing protein NRP [Helianthus annuus]
MFLMGSYYGSSTTRGLTKNQLGGVIFGTNKTTIKECLCKKLFGLPSSHFVYVKKIDPGLPVFLFNYSDRTLSGIFEAVSSGQMNIDPCAWTCEGYKTPFPAQVQIRVKLQCKALTENQFRPLINDNYHTSNHFWFELDHAQTNSLLFLLASQALSCPRTTLTAECKDKLVVNNNTMEKKKKGPRNYPMIDKLIEKLEELMAFKVAQKDTNNHVEQKINFLEQNLAKAQANIKNLQGLCIVPELETCVGPYENKDIKSNETCLDDDQILLVGGYDGGSWLSSLDCYLPSQNLTKSLSSMSTERCYGAVSKLDDELFVFGGGTCGQWFDTVESYNPAADQWTTCPPLNRKNGNLAGATVNDKIYALGGGNDADCYSTVEMLDFDVGAWIPARSMLEKRFALGAAELNGALYAVGGFDGTYYLRTAERFDPREGFWKKTESMSTMRGCSSMVVLNEKLYVLGGYDGNAMVSTVEIYDPRRGSWVFGEPMNIPRGYSAAAVAKDSIYIIGGLKSGDEINDTVECYKEGRGWEMTKTNDAYRRCFLSAMAL